MPSMQCIHDRLEIQNIELSTFLPIQNIELSTFLLLQIIKFLRDQSTKCISFLLYN
jgi:hypothetical protein